MVHTQRQTNVTVIVYTDAKSAIEVPQRKYLQDNIHLTTKVLGHIQELQRQGKTVVFNWIPSHVGIPGNEADKTAAAISEAGMGIRPSLAKLKDIARRRNDTISRDVDITNPEEESRSCSWYRGVTGDKTL